MEEERGVRVITKRTLTEIRIIRSLRRHQHLGSDEIERHRPVRAHRGQTVHSNETVVRDFALEALIR